MVDITNKLNASREEVNNSVNDSENLLSSGVVFDQVLNLGAQSTVVDVDATRFKVNTGSEVELLYLWEPSGFLPSEPFTIEDISSLILGAYVFTINGSNYEFLTLENLNSRTLRNPSGWGAVGDGIANDTMSLQKALDAKGNVMCDHMKTFFITEPLIVGSNTTFDLNTSEIVVDNSFVWPSDFVGPSRLIVMGSALSYVEPKSTNCHVKNAVMNNVFLGDPLVREDVSDINNYTSQTAFGILAQNVENGSISGCTVNGFVTSGIGADSSYNFTYYNNLLFTFRFHAIANQGASAAGRNHTARDNIALNLGGIGFDLNTEAGFRCTLKNNTVRRSNGFYKCTDGFAISSGNVAVSWSDPDPSFSCYGNSKGLTVNGDVITGYSRLSSAGTGPGAYIYDSLQWNGGLGEVITVNEFQRITISDCDFSTSISSGLAAFHHGNSGGATKSGIFMNISSSRIAVDSTNAVNANTVGMFSLGDWTDSNFNIENNYFEINGLSNQRVNVNVTSTPSSNYGVFNINNNTFSCSGIDDQFGLAFRRSNNTRYTDNSVFGCANISYEPAFGDTENFIQYGNTSDTAFTSSLVGNSVIYDYYAVGPSTTNDPITLALTPDYIGQSYLDLSNGDFYKATGETSTDWKKITP